MQPQTALITADQVPIYTPGWREAQFVLTPCPRMLSSNVASAGIEHTTLFVCVFGTFHNLRNRVIFPQTCSCCLYFSIFNHTSNNFVETPCTINPNDRTVTKLYDMSQNFTLSGNEINTNRFCCCTGNYEALGLYIFLYNTKPVSMRILIPD